MTPSVRKMTAEDGFTLLELLVAMTLLGLLTVVLFSGLHFGTQVWARSEAATTNANRVQSVQILLERELSHAYPLFVTKDAADAFVAFEGGPHAVTFLGPDPEGSGAMLRIAVEAIRNGKGTALQIVAHPELSDSGRETVLAQLDGVRSLDLAYFGATERNVAPAWHDTWRDAKHLPALVRIRATLAIASRATWPSLVIAPRIAADSGCKIDVLTKTCQGR